MKRGGAEGILKINQSQERFINLLSQDIGDNLHHLHQVQRLDHDPNKEQTLTRQMSSEFQKMMSWGRYRFGILGIEPQWFELKTLVDVLAETFAVHWHRITVRNIKNISVYSEPDILQRVLHELLDNAFKYSEGNVTLKAKANDQTLTLSITDGGMFLSEGALERLHQPVHQGLGLTICSDLLSLLNSQLQTRRSRKGESVFFFELRHI